MTTENPLSNLRDIHLPEAVSSWPPAPGWWILAVLLGLLLLFCGFWLRHWYERRKPRNEAIRLLKELQTEHQDNPQALTTLRNLSQLIRRTALTFCPQEKVASLHGSAWLEFLDKTSDSKEFSQGVGQVLAQEIFRKNTDNEMTALFPLVQKWIIKCHQQY
ncbi:MAG: DUF4381 domain-containing protein [SAR324 cluster bacterium]|nr:DUF4381 domain-containing protein [SAR324 cluster bacterium]MBL7036070.1 DUF4381 domain-containing protein [SAR324 cluster bacterium]